MNRKTGEPTVNYAEAVRRVRAGLKRPVFNISYFAGLIWPDHRMKAQGAALAVGAIVRRMEHDGTIFVFVERGRGGWKLGKERGDIMSDQLCPECGELMKERTNRTTGEIFLGCSWFPKCRGTRPLEDVDSRGGEKQEARLPSERMSDRGRRRWEQDA